MSDSFDLSELSDLPDLTTACTLAIRIFIEIALKALIDLTDLRCFFKTMDLCETEGT